MESLIREIDTLTAKASSQEQLNILDTLITHLETVYTKLEADPNILPLLLPALSDTIKVTDTKLNEKQKEWHVSLNKFGKNIDKKFTTDLNGIIPTNEDGSPDVFNALNSDKETMGDSRLLLNKIIADHFVREDHLELAEAFAKETGIEFPSEIQDIFDDMHHIVRAMRNHDMIPALKWAREHRSFLESRRSSLEFHIHRSNFIRLLVSDAIPLPENFLSSLNTAVESEEVDASVLTVPPSDLQGPHLALNYARVYFKPFFESYSEEISRLSTATLFMPLERLLRTPYASIFNPDSSIPYLNSPQSPSTPKIESLTHLADLEMNNNDMIDNTDYGHVNGNHDTSRHLAFRPNPDAVHADYLIPLFTCEYCILKKVPRVPPLKVVTDIGGGGALAKIAKVRSVMKQNKNEWSQNEELPVEIPLPDEYKFHSIFICPVSKDHATSSNPPMMMPCGHVISKESLLKHSKGNSSAHVMNRSVKCPYCPAMNPPSSALRIYF